MPHINPEKLLDVLQKIDIELITALSLSRNNELTDSIERTRARISILIQTIERLFY
jgi:hypothetical protein